MRAEVGVGLGAWCACHSVCACVYVCECVCVCFSVYVCECLCLTSTKRRTCPQPRPQALASLAYADPQLECDGPACRNKTSIMSIICTSPSPDLHPTDEHHEHDLHLSCIQRTRIIAPGPASFAPAPAPTCIQRTRIMSIICTSPSPELHPTHENHEHHLRQPQP